MCLVVGWCVVVRGLGVAFLKMGRGGVVGMLACVPSRGRPPGLTLLWIFP